MHTVGPGAVQGQMETRHTSLAVQRLKLRTSNAGGAGLIPGQGTKIPHAVWRGQKNINNK